MDKIVALALLGLQVDNPSESQIRDAYHNAVQINHPDHHSNNERLRIYAEEHRKPISQTYDFLLNSNDDEKPKTNQTPQPATSPEATKIRASNLQKKPPAISRPARHARCRPKHPFLIYGKHPRGFLC